MHLLSLAYINKRQNTEKYLLIVKYLSKIDIWIHICSSINHSHLQLFRMMFYFPEKSIKFYYETFVLLEQISDPFVCITLYQHEVIRRWCIRYICLWCGLRKWSVRCLRYQDLGKHYSQWRSTISYSVFPYSSCSLRCLRLTFSGISSDI